MDMKYEFNTFFLGKKDSEKGFRRSHRDRLMDFS